MFLKTSISVGLAVLAAIAAAQQANAQTTDSGGLLRDRDGKTLYSFDRDAAGSSTCYDACAAAWPPFLAQNGAQPKDKLTLHERKDGSRQWVMNAKPLYYFTGDTKPGDTAGDGSGGVWHVVKSGGAPSAPARAGYGGRDY